MPKKTKFSRQRASIKEYLSHTKEHPTADTVYTHLREEYPNISLGTVYRNLNLLADNGEIVKISTPDGGDRFDMQTTPHYHVICDRCGRVDDIIVNEETSEFINQAARQVYDGRINDHSIIFHGICKDCLTEEEECANL